MLLVIFGAGASYDSVPRSVLDRMSLDEQTEWRPPLAKDLFGDRQAFEQVLGTLPQCAGLVAHLQRRLNEGAILEQELETVVSEATSYPPRHRELMALRFYLQDALWTCGNRWRELSSARTNYVDLFRRIDRWRFDVDEHVCIVTFNYDLLADEAAYGQLSLDLSSVAAYVSDQRYKYVKLHGSVNWGRKAPAPGGTHYVKREQARRVLIDHAAELVGTLGDYVIVNPEATPSEGSPPSLLAPAIAIPTEKKKSFECPEAHLAVMEDCIRQTDRILVVGWRGAEQHFLERLSLLPGMATPTLVVTDSREGGHETRTRLGSSGLDMQSIGWVAGGVSSFLAGTDLEQFLSSSIQDLRWTFLPSRST